MSFFNITRKIIYLTCFLMLCPIVVDATQMDAAQGQISSETSEDLELIDPNFSFAGIVEQLEGMSVDGGGIWERAKGIFFREIRINVAVAVRLIGIIIICGVLKNLQSDSDGQGVAGVTFFTCYLMQAGMVTVGFLEIIKMAQRISNDMILFMQISVPAMIVYLVSSGKVVSAQALSPGMLLMMQVIGFVIKTVIAPMSYMSLALALVNNISDNPPLKRLASLIKKTAITMLTAMLIIFTGLLSATGLFTSKMDDVTLKTTKFAVSGLIPVAGGVLSEAVETVSGAVSAIKAVHGAAIIIFLCLIAVVPIIKIAVALGIFNLTAAVVEPFSDKRLSDSLSQMTGCLSISLALVTTVLVMLIISVSVVIRAGGG